MNHVLIGFEPNSAHAIRWTGPAGGSAWWCELASAAGILHFETPDEATMVYVADGDTLAVAEDQVREDSDSSPFIVYNAQGQEVYRHKVQHDDYDDPAWDGKGNDGQRVASGVYFWVHGLHRGKVVIVR
jgi:hypothetical protein